MKAWFAWFAPLAMAMSFLAMLLPTTAPGQPDCSLPGVDDKCEAWVATYDGPQQGLDTPRNLSYATQTIAVAPTGNRVYVTGSSWGGSPGEGGTHYDYTTIAYEAASGAQVWIAHYNGPGNSQDSGWSLAVSPDGSRVFVAGMSHMGAPNWDFATVAYDAATGAELWASRYDASSVDRAWSLAVSPDGGRVFVTGESNGDYGTVAYEAATGDEVWAASYDGPAAASDIARLVVTSSDGGRIFVTGVSEGGLLTQTDFATVAYDASSGAEEWVARYNGTANGDDRAYGIGVNPDGGRVFVTGQRDGSVLSGLDYATVAYNAATGAEDWAAIYNGPGNSLDIPLFLAVDQSGGRIYVTGYSSGLGTSYDYGTVAYDAASGAEQWVARYNGPAQNNSDIAYALGVSPGAGTLFVTGESPPLNPTDPYDIATLAYDAATGAQEWVARYSGPENFQDGAFALAVNPVRPAVYVNGETWHSSTPGVGDYATLAYEIETTSVSLPGPPVDTKSFLLGPNPFSSTTSIGFSIPETAPVALAIYDTAGRKVRTLVDAVLNPGSYTRAVDGSGLSAGVYFYRLSAGDLVATGKMARVKE